MNTCDACYRCLGCQRPTCADDRPSPGEGVGLCAECWDVTRPDDIDEPREQPCCPNSRAAARNLCACWGLGAGQWIGSNE